MTVETALPTDELRQSWHGQGDVLGGRMPPVSRATPAPEQDADLPILPIVSEPLRPRIWPGL